MNNGDFFDIKVIISSPCLNKTCNHPSILNRYLDFQTFIFRGPTGYLIPENSISRSRTAINIGQSPRDGSQLRYQPRPSIRTGRARTFLAGEKVGHGHFSSKNERGPGFLSPMKKGTTIFFQMKKGV